MEDVATHQRILEAFLELAHGGGIEEITLQRVAKKAGVAYGTVRYYFNERDLSMSRQAAAYVGRCAQDFVESYLRDRLHAGKQPGILCWLEANLRWAEKHPLHVSFVLYFYYLCSTRALGHELNRDFLGVAVRRVQELLYLDIGRERLPRVERIEELALSIHSQVIGGIFRAAADPDFKSWRKIQPPLERALLALVEAHK
jgi:AcrR family transcriptional regulator